MSPIFSERQFSGANIETYTFDRKRHVLIQSTLKGNSMWSINKILVTTFLPVGYPHSVRPEYFTYQCWDSVQGISSYLRSVLTTRSVLTGVGVGSANVTPLSAAIAWVVKDGFGMIGSLTFAYLFAEHFEVYTKEWRLFADVLNNVGLTLDLLSSVVPHNYFLPLSCVSVLSKSCCGLVAGATKARISAHFARTGHLADVTVKEGTQETAVALCGLLLGALLTRCIGSDDASTWMVFLALLILHQYSNYRLVRVLEFDTLNPQRCYLLTQATHSDSICASSPHDGGSSSELLADMLPSPKVIAALETFSLPFYLTTRGPLIGVSFQRVMDGLVTNSRGGECDVDKFDTLCNMWKDEHFLLSIDKSGRVVVCLEEGCSARDIVKAHFISYHLHQALYSSKVAIKVNVDELLKGDFVKQAKLWFDVCISKALYLDVVVSGDNERPVIQQWNVHDMSSLKGGDWRYKREGSKQI